MHRLLLIVLLLAATARAQVLPDRTTLGIILGGSGTLVDFQTFSIADGTAQVFTGVNLLDATTIVSSQGPNLVPAGIAFHFHGGSLDWEGPGYFGAPSREILSDIGSTISFDFATPAIAFGLDLRSFTGFTATASVSMYAADHTTLIANVGGIFLPSTGLPVFFGYQAAGGIGLVVITQDSHTWSAIIDNVEFSAIPEPPVLPLLGGGLALLLAWRRRFFACPIIDGNRNLPRSAR